MTTKINWKKKKKNGTNKNNDANFQRQSPDKGGYKERIATIRTTAALNRLSICLCPVR